MTNLIYTIIGIMIISDPSYHISIYILKMWIVFDLIPPSRLTLLKKDECLNCISMLDLAISNYSYLSCRFTLA